MAIKDYCIGCYWKYNNECIKPRGEYCPANSIKTARRKAKEKESEKERKAMTQDNDLRSLVKKMRDAQIKYETLRVKAQYVNEASREDFDAIAEAAYEAFVLENEVDKMLQMSVG